MEEEPQACRRCGHELIGGIKHTYQECKDNLYAYYKEEKRRMGNLIYKNEKLERQIAALITAGDKFRIMAFNRRHHASYPEEGYLQDLIDAWDKAKGEIE